MSSMVILKSHTEHKDGKIVKRRRGQIISVPFGKGTEMIGAGLARYYNGGAGKLTPKEIEDGEPDRGPAEAEADEEDGGPDASDDEAEEEAVPPPRKGKGGGKLAKKGGRKARPAPEREPADEPTDNDAVGQADADSEDEPLATE